MAALLLGDTVLTMIPTPFSGAAREAIGRAVDRVPTYLDMMHSWRWSEDLWRAGVVASKAGGFDVAEDVRASCRRITTDDSLAPLRAFMNGDLFTDEDEYLRAVSRDILRGGPDPAVCVPLSAGLDRFAARHGLIVARSDAQSVAQRAETNLSTRLAAMVVPILIQSGGTGLISARAELADSLAALRQVIDDIADHSLSNIRNGDGEAHLRAAAKTYTESFTDLRHNFDEPDDEVRLVDGLASITFVSLPSDAVLLASVEAARSVLGSQVCNNSGPSNLPILRDSGDGRFVSMIVRIVGARNGRV